MYLATFEIKLKSNARVKMVARLHLFAGKMASEKAHSDKNFGSEPPDGNHCIIHFENETLSI